MTAAQALFSFEGRLRRRDWWLYAAGLLILDIALQFAGMAMLGASLMPNTFGPRVGFDLAGWRLRHSLVEPAATLIVLWPSLAVGIKRLHDRDRPALWAPVLGGLCLLNQACIAARLVTGAGIFGLVAILSLFVLAILGAWLLVEMGLLDGTRGPNRHGPSPKQSFQSAEGPAT